MTRGGVQVTRGGVQVTRGGGAGDKGGVQVTRGGGAGDSVMAGGGRACRDRRQLGQLGA